MDTATNTEPRLTKRDRVSLNRQRTDQIRCGFENLSEQRKIFIDCSFGSVMDLSERSSLTLQIQECYSHLRRFGNGTTQMFVVSASDEIKASLTKQGGDQWAIHCLSDPLEEVLKSPGCDRETIFLSPDATEELTCDDLKHVRGFILGGIVDKKVSKNETAHKAIRMEIKCRRLPIDIQMCRNKVFNIDTVFMFLLRGFSSNISCRQEMMDLLIETLPDRKLLTDSTSNAKTQTIKFKTSPEPSLQVEKDRIKLTSYDSVVKLFQSYFLSFEFVS